MATLSTPPISGRPRTISGRPRTISGRPRTISGRPQAVSGRPQAVRRVPQAFRRRPRATAGDPAQLSLYGGCTTTVAPAIAPPRSGLVTLPQAVEKGARSRLALAL
jgi:hypothetical protein